MPKEFYGDVKEARYPWKIVKPFNYGVFGLVMEVVTSSKYCGFPDRVGFPSYFGKTIFVARIPKKDVVPFILRNGSIREFDHSGVSRWK